MTTASPLDRALDVFRVRQYFNVLARGAELLDGVRRDAVFVDDVRRALLPMTANGAWLWTTGLTGGPVGARRTDRV